MRICHCGRFMIGLAVLFVASGQFAGETQKTIPQQIGGLPYKDFHKFEQKELGGAINYEGEGLKLTIYLYNAGMPLIPPGITSEVFKTQFAQAEDDIVLSTSFKDVRLISDTAVKLGDQNLELRKAVFELSVDDTPYVSVLYLTAGRNLFYKARLSGPKQRMNLLEQQVANIEKDLGELIAFWISKPVNNK